MTEASCTLQDQAIRRLGHLCRNGTQVPQNAPTHIFDVVNALLKNRVRQLLERFHILVEGVENGSFSQFPCPQAVAQAARNADRPA